MIRPATLDDLESILEIYKIARAFMRSNGNMSQWINNYPDKALLIGDISKNQLFVYEEDGAVHGVFAFIVGEDETYKVIENGKWLSDAPYGTIHRIAGDGKTKGLLQKAVAYCEKTVSHLRIDTHADNKIMQHVVIKNGFTQCGIIHIADGTPRIAYEKI